MFKTKLYRLAASLAIAIASAGGALAKERPVKIDFALTADGKQVGCGAPLTNLGPPQIGAKLHDARLYVHEVNLIDAKGKRTPVSLTVNLWQNAGVALIDFMDARGGAVACSKDNPAKNTSIAGSAPSGAYVGLEFSVGVPVQGVANGQTISLNHSSTETSAPPLDVAAMAWNWQGGRKFMLVEVDPPESVTKSDGGKSKSWFVHLGSAGCKGNPATGEMVSCQNPNRFTVTFDKFDPAKNRVELDLSALFRNTDLRVDKGGATGCMSGGVDPDCVAIFEALGLNLVETAPGAGDAGRQRKPGVSPAFTVGSNVVKSAGAPR